MAQESGPKLVEALAALKRGHDGKIAPESLAAIHEAVREGVAAEAEGNLRVVNSTDIAAGSNATQEILVGLMRGRLTSRDRWRRRTKLTTRRSLRACAKSTQTRATGPTTRWSPCPGSQRPESLFSPPFSKYPKMPFKSHKEFNETVPRGEEAAVREPIILACCDCQKT